MERKNVELAIIELNNLLEQDSSDENDYQKWFERHSIAFLALGYSNVIPHPQIAAINEEKYIPDFLVQRPNGLWEIFEIKTVQTTILRDKERRATFYATFEQYLSQCHDYVEVLDEKQTRELVKQKYNIDFLQKRATSILVAGRSEGLNLEKVFNLASRRTPPITVFTYDDVMRALEIYRTFNFGHYENAKGASIFSTFMIHKPKGQKTNNHILDIGIYPDQDRIALSINNEGFLCLEVWDSKRNIHKAHSKESLNDTDYDMPLWFEFEVGINSEFSFLSIQIEYKYRADIRINNFPFNLTFETVLGSDWYARKYSWFSMSGLIVYSRTLTFEEKLNLRKYGIEKRKLIYSGEKDSWVEFRGHKWLSTEGHPTRKLKLYYDARPKFRKGIISSEILSINK